MATTAASGRVTAIATAMQPLPVPTSTARPLAPGAAQRLERRIDGELGFRARDQDVGCDLEIEAVELARAGQIRHRHAIGAAVDERA